MDEHPIKVGDAVIDSPVGAGVVTGLTQAGYPQVNEVAVVWLQRADGLLFDPHEKHPDLKKEVS